MSPKKMQFNKSLSLRDCAPRIASRGPIDFIAGVDDDHIVQNNADAACGFCRSGF